MRQQINLISALPKKKLVRLPVDRMVQICGGFLLLLLIIYGIGVWREFKLNESYQAVQLQEQTMIKQIESLIAQYPKEEADPVLKQQVDKLEAQLIVSNQILVVLQTSKTVNLVGFSQYLQALANTIPSTVWLTAINITQAGDQVELRGKAYDNPTVLAFAYNLNHAPLFTKLKLDFHLVKLVQAKDADEGSVVAIEHPIYDFIITTNKTNEKNS